MNRTFYSSTQISPSTDVSPAALKAVVHQAHADRSAFVATILIGFGKKLKELVSGAQRGPTTAAGPHRLRSAA